MHASHVRIVAGVASASVADELVTLLQMVEESRKNAVEITQLDSVPCIESDSDDVWVFVESNPLSLSRLIGQVRSTAQRAAMLFVDFFHNSSPCLELLSAGFDDFLSYPFQTEVVRDQIRASIDRNKSSLGRPKTEQIKNRLSLEAGLEDIVGNGSSFRYLLSQVSLLALSDAPVLISGETGTGKDLCARAIHYSSARQKKPFVPINCGALPDDLLENELFGHERGAFTDARDSQQGMVRQAEGGTIYLDEVEALTARNQVKLLRLVHDKEYSPLGGSMTRKADVRIIAATNEDLLDKVREKGFRQDLYFRLQVLSLSLPPLRKRIEDLACLSEFFLTRYCSLYCKPRMFFDHKAIEKLKSHPWPGNIRELENVIHRTVLNSSNVKISVLDISFDDSRWDIPMQENNFLRPFNEAKKMVVDSFEREYVQRLLRLCNGNVSLAARHARKNRRAFWEIMRKHQLSRM